jgi:hypothetical protein
MSAAITAVRAAFAVGPGLTAGVLFRRGANAHGHRPSARHVPRVPRRDRRGSIEVPGLC